MMGMPSWRASAASVAISALRLTSAIATSAALGVLLAMTAFAARVEIRENRFYVDGSPFYVKAVGYVPLRPHQKPGASYTGINYDWMHNDFARIRAARFNTIRTWEPFTTEELALAREHGLMVIQGIRLDPQQDFSKPYNQENALAHVTQAAEQSKASDNVLGYLVISRPWPQAVLDSGTSETLEFLRRLKRAIQQIDPRPVSMDSWIPIAFLPQNDFDFVSFTAYDFWPKSINQSLGFPGYVRWLVNRFAADRPLLITATGGYAVSKASATAAGGFGGLSEYEQGIRDLKTLRETVEGHAAGSTLFSWLDHWSGAGDPDVHDNEPWEWTGVCGIDTDSPKDKAGIPREIYSALIPFNAATVLEPKANHLYGIADPLPIQVFTSPDIAFVRYSVNGEDWKSLVGSGQGMWQGFFRLPKLARRRQHVSIKAFDKDQTLVTEKDVSFVAAVRPEVVSIRPEKNRAAGGGLQFAADLRNGRQQPIPQRKLYWGCFYPVTLRESWGTAMTDAKGEAVIVCRDAPKVEDKYLYVSAGTDDPDRIRAGDLRIFELGK